MAAPPYYTQQMAPAPAQQAAHGGGGILRPFLQQLFGPGGGGAGAAATPGLVIYRVDPSAVRSVIETISSELKIEQLIKSETAAPIRSLLEELSLLSDLSTKLAQILSRYVRDLSGLIVDPSTAPREVKARLVQIATEAKAIYEMLVGKKISELMDFIERLSRGEHVSEAEFVQKFRLSEIVQALTLILTAFTKACNYIRLALYMNMPATQRSPVFNMLAGFEIIRR